MHKANFSGTRTPVVNPEWVDFPVSIGIRIRLSPEQKQLIKTAYDRIASGEVEEETTSTLPGKLRVSHNATPRNLINEMGADRFTLSSLLGSNERQPVGMIKRWERVLGIQLLTKKELDEAWKGYLKHLGY